jgi:hypothetical protein
MGTSNGPEFPSDTTKASEAKVYDESLFSFLLKLFKLVFYGPSYNARGPMLPWVDNVWKG